MPVAIGDELKLENNKVNAYYDNLFRKLNVAKAWTNVTTTESGGTVSIVNDTGITTNMECEYNKFFIALSNSSDAMDMPICVINGKMYKSTDNGLVQIGNKTNWKKCSSCGSYAYEYLYGIDEDNKLYKFTNVSTGTIEEIGSGINWTDISGLLFPLMIGDGKLYNYRSDTGLTQIGSETGWTKIVASLGGVGLCNGYPYRIEYSGTGYTGTVQLMDSNNNYIDIVTFKPSYKSAKGISFLNSLGELYYNDNTDHLTKSNFNNGTIKKVSNDALGDTCVVTTDGKLYNGNNDVWTELGSGINWADAIFGEDNNIILAIGNNRLYKIDLTISGGVVTQIGTSTGYKKIMGNVKSGYSKYIALVWTGNATETSTTIYTTNNPLANDKTYSDINLTEYSVVQSCNGTTLTDNFRTYELDISKNSSFNKIPTAAAHETVKAIDLLRATE